MSPDMFDYEPPKAKRRPNYTLHLIIVVIVFSVSLFSLFLGKENLGLTTSIILGSVALAVGSRWELRKHLWFWVLVVLLLALHIPLFSMIPLPRSRGNIGLLGLGDFLFFFIAIWVADAIAERFFPPSASSGYYEN
ncbi:hypothetical protein [Candidatus Korobacter versatilis]|uniref:hypothetical protein n=1 Tax=Candidatus Korobacter versatilis TaxID=658062 RepID=UPI0005A456EC|nr:hypothetical protein [Candidatus Koribacter versatilis]